MSRLTLTRAARSTRWTGDRLGEVADYPFALALLGKRPVAVTVGGGVYALEGGAAKRLWSSDDGEVLAIAADPLQRLVAVATFGGSVSVLGEDGRSVAEARFPGQWLQALCFNDDGSLLAVAAGRTVTVLDRAGMVCGQLGPFASAVSALQFFPASSTLAVACYGGVHVIVDGIDAYHLPFSGSVLALAISPKADVIAAGTQDCLVHFWRLPSLRDAEMSGYARKPTELWFHPRGRWLVTSGDDKLTCWSFVDGPEGSLPRLLAGHESPVERLLGRPGTNQLLSVGRNGSLFLWDLDAKAPKLAEARLPSAATCVAWLGQNLLAAGTADGSITAFNVAAPR